RDRNRRVRFGGRAVEVEHPRAADVIGRLVLRDATDLLDDAGHALGLAEDDAGRAQVGRFLRALALDQLGVADDRGERLVELVRRGASELGNQRLLLGQLQLLLRVEEALLHADALA